MTKEHICLRLYQDQKIALKKLGNGSAQLGVERLLSFALLNKDQFKEFVKTVRFVDEKAKLKD